MSILYFEEFGKAFIPSKIRPQLNSYLAKAGIDDAPYPFFGMLFWITAAITYFIYIPGIYPLIKDANPFVFFILTFFTWFAIQIILAALVILSVYFYLNIRIYKRTKELEDFLPDYLTLVSTNLKGGMNFEKSLWGAIRPEFNTLSKEIGIVSKKVATGNDVSEAIDEFSKKYDSPILRRSMDLLKGEILSGGSITGVIDNIVSNLKKIKALRQEMVASTLTYMIFMAAIVVFITPVLFALSKQLLVILLNLGERLSTSLTSSTVSIISFSVAAIDPLDFQLFSVLAIAIIAIFSSMIISTIEKGDLKGGIKYIPLFTVGGIIMYFIFAVILEKFMGGLAF